VSDYTAAEDFIDCPLFHGLTLGELQNVVNLLLIEKYEAGATIFSEGETHAVICIILEGRCRIKKKSKSGEELEIAEVGPLRTFGEMSFFHPAPHSATVTAATDLVIARLDRARFHSLVDFGSQAALKILYNTVGVLAERLRVMDEYAAEMANSEHTKRTGQEWGEFRSKLYTEWEF